MWINEFGPGKFVMLFGIAMILSMMFGGSARVIRESLAGTYNKQVDISFRMGMMWFIFSEVMFFAAFFGALFYARTMVGAVARRRRRRRADQYFLWNGYTAAWPTNGPANVGGAFETMARLGRAAAQHADPALVGRDHHDRAPRVARRSSHAHC